MKIVRNSKSLSSFVILLFLAITMILGCINKPDLVSLEIQYSEFQPGGSEINLVIDFRKQTGTISKSISGINPMYETENKPDSLSIQTIDSVKMYLNNIDFTSWEPVYENTSNEFDNEYSSSIIRITTAQNKYEIKVRGVCNNKEIKQLYRMVGIINY